MIEETPFQTPPTSVPIPPAPVYIPPKPKFSILPLLFGFLIVIILAAVFGVVYYKNKLTVSTVPSPTPTPSSEPCGSECSELLSPSPTTSSSSSPKSSAKPTSKPTAKPTSTPTPAPTATPVPQPTLDIRFGNPSVNIKQTYDDGSGDGRVINREYSSIQSGYFDEVPASWSPRITVCFHLVASEEIKGSDLKFTYSLDGTNEADGDLSQYDKLEAGRLYDWCHDTTSSIGSHTAKLLLNGGKSLKESGYTNNLARVDWSNLADKIAPNFTLVGPNNEAAAGTCLLPQYISDNVTPYDSLKIEQKVDDTDWATFTGSRYCFTGTTGASHTYSIRITDARGNANEQKKTFVLY